MSTGASIESSDRRKTLTPSLRTPAEHPFRRSDLATFSKYFDRVEIRHFCLMSLVAIAFHRLPFSTCC